MVKFKVEFYVNMEDARQMRYFMDKLGTQMMKLRQRDPLLRTMGDVHWVANPDEETPCPSLNGS